MVPVLFLGILCLILEPVESILSGLLIHYTGFEVVAKISQQDA